MNFGDAVEFYTEAMQYNRRCDVFLLLLLLLFIPPFRSTRGLLVVDGILFGAIAALLFIPRSPLGWSRSEQPIFILRKRDNLIVIALGTAVFIAIAARVEFGYGIKFGWVSDIAMAAHAVRENHLRILHIWRDNGLELFFFLVIPTIILFSR